MLGVLGRLLPWAFIFWFWFSLNRALDKIDAEKAERMASPFWKRFYFLWGWTIGTKSKFTTLRYIVTGIVLFFLLRWVVALLSTPFP